MEGTLSTLHPNCIFEDLSLKKVYRGIDGARRYYAELWKAFDITVESRQRHWTLEGNLIAETTFVGPQRSDFLGNASRGMSIRLPLVVIVTFREELRQVSDFIMTLRTSFGKLAHNILILENSCHCWHIFQRRGAWCFFRRHFPRRGLRQARDELDPDDRGVRGVPV